MMFVMLLVPVVLLGLLLGMDRLERWTTGDGDGDGDEPATPAADAVGPSAPPSPAAP
jgi:hypothetical protein